MDIAFPSRRWRQLAASPSSCRTVNRKRDAFRARGSIHVSPIVGTTSGLQGRAAATPLSNAPLKGVLPNAISLVKHGRAPCIYTNVNEGERLCAFSGSFGTSYIFRNLERQLSPRALGRQSEPRNGRREHMFGSPQSERIASHISAYAKAENGIGQNPLFWNGLCGREELELSRLWRELAAFDSYSCLMHLKRARAQSKRDERQEACAGGRKFERHALWFLFCKRLFRYANIGSSQMSLRHP